MTGRHRLHDATGILLADEFGDSVVKADGAAPTDAESGYVPGGLYVDTLNARQYVNLGTADSSDWSEQGRREVIAVTDATKTLDAGDSGALVVLDRASGIVVTLPEANAANVGVFFDFLVKTSATSSDTIKINASRSADLYYGHLSMEVSGAATGITVFPNQSDHDQIDLATDAKGRLAGGLFRVQIAAANMLVASGSIRAVATAIASPFTNAIS
tara:strand:- start:54 stop:698 length:645 start_codon:yes stop_codon:yes gene_type:complete